MFRDSRGRLEVMNGLHSGDLEHNRNTGNGFRPQRPVPYSELASFPHVDRGKDLSGGQSAVPLTISSTAEDSDIALSFINQILMEEDVEDQIYVLPGDPALIAAEKTFYDVIDEYRRDQYDSLESMHYGNSGDFGSSNNGIPSNEVMDGSWISDFAESRCYSQSQGASVDYASPSSFDSFTTGMSDGIDGTKGYELNGMRISDLYFESQAVHQLNKGVEDASKFLPGNGQSVFDLQTNDSLLSQNLILEGYLADVGEEEELSTGNSPRGIKNPRLDDLKLEEGRSAKLSANYSGENMASKMFQDVLHLCIDTEGCGDGGGVGHSFQKEVKKNNKNGALKRSNGGKSQSKKQVRMEVIDLGTVLLQCATSVAAGDRRAVNEQLQLIRQHSSSIGDGSQRLAHYFADGLEARLAGIGNRICQSRLARRSTTEADILKAYYLYMGVSPLKRISHFFANQSILNVADRAAKIHIIDFGIGFGFQWPCLFRRLSRKKGGPPKVRITGIDLPLPGFRPRERLEGTGRRLADCAHRFEVPFEYCAIASKWENIQVQDLNIEEGEVLIVNCLYMLRHLADETLIVESPRSIVLNNIRGVNPDLFVVGVMSSAYGSPFFITRFREALFYYSALFDMLESNVPREDPHRLLIEMEFFGREAMNIIACEGSERVYRPETYKQWRVRNQQAGFKQLPLDLDILKASRDKVISTYDKNFLVEEDNNWMLLGWKGRVLNALSTWKPAHSHGRI